MPSAVCPAAVSSTLVWGGAGQSRKREQPAWGRKVPSKWPLDRVLLPWELQIISPLAQCHQVQLGNWVQWHPAAAYQVVVMHPSCPMVERTAGPQASVRREWCQAVGARTVLQVSLLILLQRATLGPLSSPTLRAAALGKAKRLLRLSLKMGTF